MSLHKLCLNCELRSLRVEMDRTFFVQNSSVFSVVVARLNSRTESEKNGRQSIFDESFAESA